MRHGDIYESLEQLLPGLVVIVALAIFGWWYWSASSDCDRRHGVMVRTVMWYGCVEGAK